MTKIPIKSTPKTGSQSAPEIEHDEEDVFEAGEFSLSEGLAEEETIKRDARRKIEIYWEKKRLREQFEDFDESEFGF
ncbi:MAG: PA3496 family putative envelope integrity protein [Methylococcaceae bacterium]